jgi:hypothetical protein
MERHLIMRCICLLCPCVMFEVCGVALEAEGFDSIVE